jgi:hypothetical protein
VIAGQTITFTLVEHVQGLIRLRVRNYFDNKAVADTEITCAGVVQRSDVDGVVKVRAPMLERITIKAKRTGFISME